MKIAEITNAPSTMTSLEMAELTEKRHDNVKRTVETLVSQGVIALPQIEEVSNTGPGPKMISVYAIGKRDSYIVVAQLSPEFTARIVDRWQELESKASMPVMALPQDYIQALECLLASKKSEQLAINQRDTAIATKAEIGNRREATAMATASTAVRKITALEIELDKSKQYATVKRMEMIYHGQKFDWRKLKSTAAEMSMPGMDVFDQNYGTVKAYHADVWRETYALSIDPS